MRAVRFNFKETRMRQIVAYVSLSSVTALCSTVEGKAAAQHTTCLTVTCGVKP